jgi:diaminohydroxyphosphoribosylaminopyrimidine deaminase/5-amino-6-(5-phosphoribosylamino)uracil reductase
MAEIVNTDNYYMRAAILQAEQGFGRTSPNPLVGAVIVKNSQIIGAGFHAQAGKPHAEINALNNCTELPGDAELFVTMEPCCTYGRTPPCTDAIIQAGIRRVCIGSIDPNPAHAGRGVEILRDAGIEVQTGVEKDVCDSMNSAFFKWITTKSPYVILKMAATLDGKIATAAGQSKWITGEAARQRVQRLRQWADAIMIGGNTARIDHPALTVRDIADWRQPRRIIVSQTLTAADVAVLLPLGVIPEVVSPAADKEWRQLMLGLGAENVTALLIEGGGELAAAVLNAGVVDLVEFHLAPKILGGRDSVPVVGGCNPVDLADATNLSDLKIEQSGDDLIITGCPVKHTASGKI